MGIFEGSITSKGQTTVPAAMREELNLKENSKIVWISIRPGEFSVVSKEDLSKGQDWVDKLYGIIKDDSWDCLEELKKYKKEDLKLEKRGLKD